MPKVAIYKGCAFYLQRLSLLCNSRLFGLRSGDCMQECEECGEGLVTIY